MCNIMHFLKPKYKIKKFSVLTNQAEGKSIKINQKFALH